MRSRHELRSDAPRTASPRITDSESYVSDVSVLSFDVSSRSAANQCASASPGNPCAYSSCARVAISSREGAVEMRCMRSRQASTPPEERIASQRPRNPHETNSERVGKCPSSALRTRSSLSIAASVQRRRVILSVDVTMPNLPSIGRPAAETYRRSARITARTGNLNRQFAQPERAYPTSPSARCGAVRCGAARSRGSDSESAAATVP
jgi:hypothetical protein